MIVGRLYMARPLSRSSAHHTSHDRLLPGYNMSWHTDNDATPMDNWCCGGVEVARFVAELGTDTYFLLVTTKTVESMGFQVRVPDVMVV